MRTSLLFMEVMAQRTSMSRRAAGSSVAMSMDSSRAFATASRPAFRYAWMMFCGAATALLHVSSPSTDEHAAWSMKLQQPDSRCSIIRPDAKPYLYTLAMSSGRRTRGCTFSSMNGLAAFRNSPARITTVVVPSPTCIGSTSDSGSACFCKI